MEELPKLLLLSDFNIENLRSYLENLDGAPRVQARTAPFGQVMPALLDPNHEVWSERYDGVVVWTRPQGVCESFGRALQHSLSSRESFLQEVEQFATRVIKLKQRAGTILFPSWVLAPHLRGLGPIDFRATGLARLLLESNLLFARRFEQHPEVMMLNAQRWIEKGGAAAHDPKYWYMGKIPFAPPVFQQAALEIRAALAGVQGQARKLVIVDLDDTLWGGIIGDDGVQGIRLGGHDGVGEAFVDFQEGLLALRNRGVVLGIVSKNDEAVAMEAIGHHPEMRLRPNDFVGWRINWNDKAQNIVSLVEELNLGLQSTVFLDDNPAERARVREALPEVLVPELPKDKLLYPQVLNSLTCFDTPSINDEDLQRTEMYNSERKRAAEQAQCGSLDDWLRSLKLVVGVEPLTDRNIKRVVQLFNKTNQMNLTTRKLTESEMLEWVKQGDRALWSVRVQDRFGDSGLTGIVSVDCGGEEAVIVDFILSCRVFGRQIERLMVKVAADHARARDKKGILAKYLPTKKNKPTLEFWEHAGFEKTGPHSYRWDLRQPYDVPSFISVQMAS